MPSLFEPIISNSIEELARKISLDENELKKTVDEFNKSVIDGEFNHTVQDNCFTKGLQINKTHWALRLDKPSFYCYPLRPGITFTYIGVKVDKNARVYKDDGSLFENVFTAGEIMAGNILTQGYVAGFGMSIGTVFGKLAGENALRLLKGLK